MVVIQRLFGFLALLLVVLPDMVMAAVNPSFNIAPLATVLASSENTATTQTAMKAMDGVVAGYPEDYTKEWATVGGGSGAWIQLDWTSTYRVDYVILYDRPNPSEKILGGRLLFSDGTTVPVGALPNDGAGLTVEFAPRTVTWVSFLVDTVGYNTRNVGLSEFEIYGSANEAPVITAGPTAATLDIVAGQSMQLSVSASDPNDDPLNYNWTLEGSVNADMATGSIMTFNAPEVMTDTVMRINVKVTDTGGLSASAFVDITVHPSAPSNIAPLAVVLASSENTTTGQTANKAIDGIIAGYPEDYTKEWATVGGGAGAWIQLDWTSTYRVDHVVLYDRPNPSENILGGTLLFSDGTTVPVGALPNDGTGLTVEFAPRTVTWISFLVDTVGYNTFNVGLAEWEIYGVEVSLQSGGSGNSELMSSVLTDPPPMSIVSPRQLTVSGVSEPAQDLGLNNIVDGNLQTLWSASNMPRSLVLDLGSQQVLSRVEMLIEAAALETNLSYSLQTSLDELAWTQVFTSTSISAMPQWTVADFEPVYARYLRVNLDSTNTSVIANVYEIVPYGQNVSAYAGTTVNKAMILSWLPNPKTVDGYIIYLGESADAVTSQVTNVTTTSKPDFNPAAPTVQYDSWYDFGLLPGDTICFKVQAYNADGVSGLSTAVCRDLVTQ